MLLLAMALVCCNRQPKTDLERGAAVFSRSCASCHGLSNGTKAQLGFKVQPPNLADPALQARLGDAELKRVIREGKGQMPPFGRMLPDSEINALLVYLRSLARNNRATP
jgi:mono/diheme cytochrome c family protein